MLPGFDLAIAASQSWLLLHRNFGVPFMSKDMLAVGPCDSTCDMNNRALSGTGLTHGLTEPGRSLDFDQLWW